MPNADLIDRILLAVFECHDGSDMWGHARQDPEAFRRAVRRVLDGPLGQPDERIRVAEAVRDDARRQSTRDLEARRTAWGDGVRAALDVVKHRLAHYELYRCTCGKAPNRPHVPGCKGAEMASHPATFAILDEMHVFISALLRAETEGTVKLTLNLLEATIVATAVAHHRDMNLAKNNCESVLAKIEEACK
ncbi:MAG: hypothetical protein ACREJC_19125 [Tepidisphaeraceae bacterium]